MFWRTALAFSLLVVYYGAALAAVGVLLFFPVAMFTISTEPPNLLVATICVALAVYVAWNVFPRRLTVDPAGPRLLADSQPRLFAFLHDVARDVGQETADDVYLVLGPNVGVARQSSRLGFGNRRILTVGMPLLQVLSQRQLRTVLVHEHGHFSRGQSLPDRWIYQCRQAMIRTVQTSEGTFFPFHLVFKLYTKLFLRVTQSIARRHEVAADELALRSMGSQTGIETLRAGESANLAFFNYWNSEVRQVFEEGLRPPIAEGFDRFRRSPRVARAIREGVAQIQLDQSTDAYDSHPSLQERVDFAERLNVPEALATENDSESAWDLLEQHERLEELVLMHALDERTSLPLISWNEVGDRVYRPGWERGLQQFRETLLGVKPTDLASWIEDPVTLVDRLPLPNSTGAPFEIRRRFACDLIGVAMALALRCRGYRICGPPNEALYLEGEGRRWKPFEITEKLFSGEVSPTEWLEIWREAGVENVDLGHLAPTVVPVDAWEPARAPKTDEALLQPKTERPWWLAIVIIWFITAVLSRLGDR